MLASCTRLRHSACTKVFTAPIAAASPQGPRLHAHARGPADRQAVARGLRPAPTAQAVRGGVHPAVGGSGRPPGEQHALPRLSRALPQ
jgi:hypothetical protein